MLLILLAGTALALGLFALLRRLEARRTARGPGARLSVSRDPAVLKWTAVAIAIAAIVAAIVFGGRAWHQFSSSDLKFPANPAQHFSDLTSAGRHDFWRVAIDAFEEKPLLGHGAGTYQFSWERPALDRPMTVIDAHSLYLEAFAELGLVGGLLVLGIDRIDPLVRHSRLAGGARASARDARGALRGDAHLCDRGRLRLVLGDRRAGRRLLPRRRGARRRPLRADRRACGRKERARTELRRRRCRRRRRLARGDRPGRAAPGRTRDRIQPARRRRRKTSRAPSTTPTPPARSSPGRPPPTCSSA